MAEAADSLGAHGAPEVGRAWFLLCLALLAHVVDEALTGFLSVYNPIVEAMRDRVPWLPIPTFRFDVWLAGLLTAIVLLLFLGRLVSWASRWARPAAYAFAFLMLVNGAAHVAATLAGHTVASVRVQGPMPGFYSSPLLLAASIYLLYRLGPAYAIAALTSILGAGSLVVFGLFLWYNGFDLVDLKMATGTALAWDAGLSLAFFVQHSGMVRRPFRAWLRRFVPAHWHGMLYTLASAVALLLVVVFWQPSHIGIFAVEGPLRWFVRGLALACVAGILWGIRALGDFDVFGVQAMLSHLRGKQPDATPLSVRGPYRWVRHPFYFFGIVAIWASPVLSLDRLLFDILWTCWIVAGARLEERDLIAEFGDAYRDYRAKVPMLLPRRPAAVASKALR